MKKSLFFLTLGFTALLLTGCSFSNADNGGGNGGGDDGGEDTNEVDWDHPELSNSEDYLRFWNPTTTLSFHISVQQDAANFMNNYQTGSDSAYFDYFVPCTLIVSINGAPTTYEEVGMRVKGNLSRNIFLDNGNFTGNSLAHFKLKFNETFDGDEYTEITALSSFKKTWSDDTLREARKNRTLFDMEKVDIKWNRNDDQSQVKQSYMLKSFRDQGVLAGHTTLCPTTFSISGNSPLTETYEILEVIDSVFIKRWFDKNHADGDLYKCAYQNAPANFSSSYTVGNQIGIENNEDNYHPAYDLKTNKKKSADHKRLLALIEAINDKTSDANTYKTNIEKYIDMDNFLKYEAVAFLCGNFDDMRNNANNYYLYIASGNNIAYFIAYDFDRGLGMGCEGRSNYMTNFSAESTKMQCSGDWQSINLYWRSICSSTNSSSGHATTERVEAYRAAYQSNIEKLLNNGLISNTTFNAYVNSFPSAYRGIASGAGSNNISFASYLSLKIAAIKENNSTYNITVS